MGLIRTATARDLSALRELDAACFPPGSVDLEPAAPGEIESGLEAGAIRVVEEDGRLVAFLQADWPAPGRCWIDVLGVLPGHRRRGYGALLMDDFLASGFDPATAYAELVTSPRNRPMIALVTSRGFGAGEIRRDHFGPGKDRLLCRLPCPADLAGAPVRLLDSAEDLYEHLDSGRWTLRRVVHQDGVLRYRVHRDRLLTVTAARAYAGPTGTADLLGVEPSMDLPDKSDRPALDSRAVTKVGRAEYTRNADAEWDKFDSQAYWQHNYSSLLEADARIIDEVSEYFADTLGEPDPAAMLKAVDVGAGANLYPALLMLPWSAAITLAEYAASNVEWLRTAAADLSGEWPWQVFWDRMAVRPAYGRGDTARRLLAERAEVEKHSVFDLPRHRWQLGTMFFVAESLTEDPAEFERALHAFVDSLTPGAPFATAFMSRSVGYPVAERDFPAVSIDEEMVQTLLGPLTKELKLSFFPGDPKLRDGYDGMILALGRTRR